MWWWLANLAVSWALFALIWIVQLVHYPTFRFLTPSRFPAFHRHHTRSITLIVMPLMLIELGISVWFAWHNREMTAYIFPLLLVTIIWGSTFLIQIPLHRELAKKQDKALIDKLISSNWLRTALWTLKAIWVTWHFSTLFQPCFAF